VSTGWQAGERVTGTLYSDPIALGTQTASSSGQVTFTWTLPTSFAAGSHRVVLVGEKSGTIEKAFSVSSSGTLVTTGPAASLGFVGAGIAALLLSLVGFVMAYRRREA
jgi:LPXTG-motif cell wall-anchored protein